MNDVYDMTEPLLAVSVNEERPWAAFAACRDHDPDIFFPTTSYGETEAVRICRGCPVQLDCLEFAMEAKIRFGVWGAMTEKQRKTLHRQIA